MTLRTRIIAGALLALAAVAAFVVYEWLSMPFSISPGPIAVNYVQNLPGLSSAGMPGRKQFAGIAKEGFAIVVNLAPSGVTGSHDDERELAEAAGLRYFHVPVDFEAPQLADYDRFAAILRDTGKERVLVHCQVNLRASSFVFLYRVIELGEDPDRAFADVTRIWKPAPVWEKFLRATLLERGKRLPLELA